MEVDLADRLAAAERRLGAVPAEPPTIESVHEWLGALTDYVTALGDLHSLDSPSVHEALTALAAALGPERQAGTPP